MLDYGNLMFILWFMSSYYREKLEEEPEAYDVAGRAPVAAKKDIYAGKRVGAKARKLEKPRVELAAPYDEDGNSHVEWLEKQMAEKDIKDDALATFMFKTNRLPHGYDKKKMAQTTKNWRTGNTKFSELDVWLAVEEAISVCEPEQRILLDSGKRRQRLLTIAKTPRVGGKTLRRYMNNPPEEFKFSNISDIVRGVPSSAKRSELAHIFKAARQLGISTSGPLRHKWEAAMDAPEGLSLQYSRELMKEQQSLNDTARAKAKAFFAAQASAQDSRCLRHSPEAA